jgi:uncharacterized damage-inducible protein DinB
MGESQRIANQLRRAYEGEAWHGPCLSEMLADVTPEEAAAKPVATSHTIWDLVLHVAAWEDVVRRRVSGEPVRRVTDEENWPAVPDPTAESWKSACERLRDGNLRLREVVVSLTDSRLEERIPGGTDTVYDLCHGAVQHDLYHGGQIALLKKAVRASR